MGVYIEGLKMPKNVPLKIWLLQDGNARIQTNSGKLVHFKAVEVKAPHGRLIDAEELSSFCAIDNLENTRCVLWREIDDAPTIIKAEGKDDG